MHLAFAQRMAADTELSPDALSLIQAQPGAFLLGCIAPDARVSSGLRRADTHFFEYVPVVDPPPVDNMLTRFPGLRCSVIDSEAQAAFVAGYVTHLAMDVVWCEQLLFPHFMTGWADERLSFEMLHMLLAYLDGRDFARLDKAVQYPELVATTPIDWLPFIPDAALIDWRDLIAAQLAPDGYSMTTTILGQRIRLTGAEMQAFLDDPVQMDAKLWHNVPQAIVETVAQTMDTTARATLSAYLQT